MTPPVMGMGTVMRTRPGTGMGMGMAMRLGTLMRAGIRGRGVRFGG